MEIKLQVIRAINPHKDQHHCYFMIT